MLFQLLGEVRWATGSCHDDRSKQIDEVFDAKNDSAAVEKARKKIQKYHDEFSHMTDYGLNAELRVVRPIWSINFEDEQLARLAVSAHQAVPAHFKEKRL